MVTFMSFVSHWMRLDKIQKEKKIYRNDKKGCRGWWKYRNKKKAEQQSIEQKKIADAKNEEHNKVKFLTVW